MKDLSNKFGQSNPFKDDEILDEIVAMTYPSIGTFFDKHLTGNIAIDYDALLAKVGIVKKKENIDAGYFLDSNRQIFLSANQKQEIFFTNRKNTALAALGVKSGDVLKSVNGTDVNLQNIRNFIGQSLQWKAGDKITFEVIRNGETLKLEGDFVKGTTEIENLVIEELPDSDPKKKLRNAWLKAL